MDALAGQLEQGHATIVMFDSQGLDYSSRDPIDGEGVYQVDSKPRTHFAHIRHSASDSRRRLLSGCCCWSDGHGHLFSYCGTLLHRARNRQCVR